MNDTDHRGRPTARVARDVEDPGRLPGSRHPSAAARVHDADGPVSDMLMDARRAHRRARRAAVSLDARATLKRASVADGRVRAPDASRASTTASPGKSRARPISPKSTPKAHAGRHLGDGRVRLSPATSRGSSRTSATTSCRRSIAGSAICSETPISRRRRIRWRPRRSSIRSPRRSIAQGRGRIKFAILKELNQASLADINGIYADLNKHLRAAVVPPAGARRRHIAAAPHGADTAATAGPGSARRRGRAGRPRR